ncbi:hypothetical protein SK128_016409 [Halocaridina rubra]|uniref:Alpha-1,3-mannosyl-glycoprotein 2-beta-N-acetylglucosaminyltransferase n=1 Tax=Halocaridina rubra TaxID=373956 RepID=A0AAN9AA71_HALRR
MEVPRRKGRDRQKRFMDVVRKDMMVCGVREEDARSMAIWRRVFHYDDPNGRGRMKKYFHQAAKLLKVDAKALFVNAFNYNSYAHTVQDSKKLYRAQGIPGYGWMTSRRGAGEMLKNWVNANQSGVVWDWWIRRRMMGTWDMIIPEVPRTRHMGGGGVHITGYDQILFAVQPLSKITHVELDIKSVTEDTYTRNLLQGISESVTVRIRRHPCDVTPIPERKVRPYSFLRERCLEPIDVRVIKELKFLFQTGKSYVIYIHQPDEKREHHSYYVIALCLGINDRDPHESYYLMTTFPFYGNQVYVIFCPNSPYCQPRDPRVIYRATEDDATYARINHYPRAELKMSYALRRPPNDPEDEFKLENRHIIKYTEI